MNFGDIPSLKLEQMIDIRAFEKTKPGHEEDIPRLDQEIRDIRAEAQRRLDDTPARPSPFWNRHRANLRDAIERANQVLGE